MVLRGKVVAIHKTLARTNILSGVELPGQPDGQTLPQLKRDYISEVGEFDRQLTSVLGSWKHWCWSD